MNDAGLDPDGDGVSNLDEFKRGSFANNADSDGDGLSDAAETGTHLFVNVQDTGSNPIDEDSDHDGLTDREEVVEHGTDPNNPDSDGDGFPDGWEIVNGTTALNRHSPAGVSFWNLSQPTQVGNAVGPLPTFNDFGGGLDRADATFRLYVDFDDKQSPEPELLFETGGNYIGSSVVLEPGNHLWFRALGATLSGQVLQTFADATLPATVIESGEVELMWSIEVASSTITLWINGAPVAMKSGDLEGDWSGGDGAAFGVAGSSDVPGYAGRISSFTSGTINLARGLEFFAWTVPLVESVERSSSALPGLAREDVH